MDAITTKRKQVDDYSSSLGESIFEVPGNLKKLRTKPPSEHSPNSVPISCEVGIRPGAISPNSLISTCFRSPSETIDLIARHIFVVYQELHPHKKNAETYSDICAILTDSIANGILADYIQDQWDTENLYVYHVWARLAIRGRKWFLQGPAASAFPPIEEITLLYVYTMPTFMLLFKLADFFATSSFLG